MSRTHMEHSEQNMTRNAEMEPSVFLDCPCYPFQAAKEYKLHKLRSLADGEIAS